MPIQSRYVVIETTKISVSQPKNLSDMWYTTLESAASRVLNCTECAGRVFPSVNKSPVRVPNPLEIVFKFLRQWSKYDKLIMINFTIQ